MGIGNKSRETAKKQKKDSHVRIKSVTAHSRTELEAGTITEEEENYSFTVAVISNERK